jgi:pilus assembly protein CpaE
VTSRDDTAELDPWEALIVPDDLPQEFVEPRPGDGSFGGPTTVVLGATGGVGATLVACGIALGCATLGTATALAEFDLERGDIAGAWGVPPERTLDDLTAVIDELVPSHVEMVCHPHPSGVSLLLAPRRARAAASWDEQATRLLLQGTRMLGAVVVDAGASLGPHVEEACHQAQRIVMVAAPTLAGARRARALESILDSWTVRGEQCLVVNRGVGRDHLSARGFARAVAREISAELPRSPADADAIESGRWPTGRARRTIRTALGTLIDERLGR